MTYLATSGSRSACISIGLTTRPSVLCTYPTTHPTMVAHAPHRVVHSSHHPCALTQTLTPPPLCSHLNMCTLPNTPDHGLRNHPTTHPTTVVHSPHYHSPHLGCALTPPMVVHHSPNHLCAPHLLSIYVNTCLAPHLLSIYVNTCLAPHGEMSPGGFTITTLRLPSICVPLSMSGGSFTQSLLNTHPGGYRAACLLHGWCRSPL